jgi:hypothetical protein
MTKLGKAVLATGLAAMVATTPLPAMAAYGSRQAVSAGHAGSVFDDVSEYHRRHRHHHRRLDVDAGDVILGVGLIAAIAAIAGAADKDRRRDNRRYDEERPRDYDSGPPPSYRGSDDVGTAVTACTEAAERAGNGRVDEIAAVTRSGNGWRVEGGIGNSTFTCSVSDGRVDDIRIGDREI